LESQNLKLSPHLYLNQSQKNLQIFSFWLFRILTRSFQL